MSNKIEIHPNGILVNNTFSFLLVCAWQQETIKCQLMENIIYEAFHHMDFHKIENATH